MPRFKIQHITKYTYNSPVRDSANQIILFPIKDEYQEVMKHDLIITGDPVVETYNDYYGNEVGSFMHAAAHTSMVIDSRMEVITKAHALPDDRLPKEEQWAYLRLLRGQMPFMDFMKVEQFDGSNELATIAEVQQSRERTPLEAARELTRYVYEHFEYIKGVTSVETTLNEIWKLKAGVCQDFAHILSAMLRSIDMPARYVSGYVCPNKGGMRGEGATHAWVEAYIPFYGWLGFDPTNNVLATDLHVRLAVGRNFSDCSPAKGTYKGTSSQTLEVGVTVSYDSGYTHNELNTVLTPQPNPSETRNSYRKFMEQQQQQQ